MKSSVKQLFIAIYRGDSRRVATLLPSISSKDINYQLTEADINALKQEMGIDLDDAAHYYGFEEGMTPLLVALSKERVSIADKLLTHPEIDVAIANSIGVNALHMLVMISFGDERYDAYGLNVVNPVALENLVGKLLTLSSTLIAKGCPLANPSIGGDDINLVTEAIFHEQVDIAEGLVKHGAPLPQTRGQLSRMRNYYDMNLAGVESAIQISRERLQQVYHCLEQALFLEPTAPGPAFFNARKSFEITNAQTIKAILRNLVIDGETRVLKAGVTSEEVIELIKDLELASRCGCAIESKEFDGFLSGYGAKLPEEVKAVLTGISAPDLAP